MKLMRYFGPQISADNGVFGQTGPKVGSFDAGYGSTQMVRLIGTMLVKAKSKWCSTCESKGGLCASKRLLKLCCQANNCKFVTSPENLLRSALHIGV